MASIASAVCPQFSSMKFGLDKSDVLVGSLVQYMAIPPRKYRTMSWNDLKTMLGYVHKLPPSTATQDVVMEEMWEPSSVLLSVTA